ncbi:virulence associated secretory protein [Salmonella enterica subsp. enterica]|uniref:Virulence associated secretory protein n=1 Tax=Salmonella enterica I TaxID=59201 RepID=A0A379W4Z4_SALET|nr:virulence associated secretory protein [Salmonella enterica subsp. enterica]
MFQGTVYVDMVVNAATMMDKQNDGIELGRQKIGVMRLNNTFVGDRTYNLRDQKWLSPVLPRPLKGYCRGEEQPLGNIVSSEPRRCQRFQRMEKKVKQQLCRWHESAGSFKAKCRGGQY